jgi:hypothetical protein
VQGEAVNIWQVQVWSIERQRWETCLTTGDKERARETWNRLSNDGLSPRLVRL